MHRKIKGILFAGSMAISVVAAIALCALFVGCIGQPCGEHNGWGSQEQKSDTASRPITVSDLSTFRLTPGATKSIYRAMRNTAYAYLLERMEAERDIDGTYTLEYPPRKAVLSDGWQVSFQTTASEGLDASPMPDEEYDATVEELSRLTGSPPYLGIYGDIPELSFRCETRELAMEIAARYNQSCIADNARIASGKLDGESFPRNPGYNPQRNRLHIGR